MQNRVSAGWGGELASSSDLPPLLVCRGCASFSSAIDLQLPPLYIYPPTQTPWRRASPLPPVLLASGRPSPGLVSHFGPPAILLELSFTLWCICCTTEIPRWDPEADGTPRWVEPPGGCPPMHITRRLSGQGFKEIILCWKMMESKRFIQSSSELVLGITFSYYHARFLAHYLCNQFVFSKFSYQCQPF